MILSGKPPHFSSHTGWNLRRFCLSALLSERAFSFTPNEYISIHRKLFTGIYSHAGRIRDYNITKKEWVLNGATVLYGSATELRATLDYDFSEEKKFSYKKEKRNSSHLEASAITRESRNPGSICTHFFIFIFYLS